MVNYAEILVEIRAQVSVSDMTPTNKINECHHLSWYNFSISSQIETTLRDYFITDKLSTSDRHNRWWSGVVVSMLASINKVNQRPARLVLRWVTVSGFNSQCETFISVCDQPPRSTQPGHPFVCRRNEYQPKGGDALRQGSKGRYSSCVGGR